MDSTDSKDSVTKQTDLKVFKIHESTQKVTALQNELLSKL